MIFRGLLWGAMCRRWVAQSPGCSVKSVNAQINPTPLSAPKGFSWPDGRILAKCKKYDTSIWKRRQP